MDKERIAAIAAHGEQIKVSSAEYRWICRGIKRAPLPDKPVATDSSVDPKNLQLQPRPLNRATPTTR